MNNLKESALHSRHVGLNARMVPFAGFEMPLQYSSVVEEHLTVRNEVGIFDLSHMGEFEICGPGAEGFLQQMTINDVSNLSPGQAQYTAMCLENGGIVDDCVLYRLERGFLLVVNAANIEKDFRWLKSHAGVDVQLADVSDVTSLIAVQGPLSRQVLLSIVAEPSLLHDLRFYHHRTLPIDGKKILCARTGYTGELGYELYVTASRSGKGKAAADIWDRILRQGENLGIKPIGLGARDTLRLEMKYCLYGHDIDESTNPIEAGLGWITKFDKGKFIGKAAIQRVKAKKPSRRMVAFEMIKRGIPRQGYDLVVEDKVVGAVTSGNYSPSLGRGIGMGYVAIEQARIGTPIQVNIRGKLVPAEIVKPPFWKQGSLMK